MAFFSSNEITERDQILGQEKIGSTLEPTFQNLEESSWAEPSHQAFYDASSFSYQSGKKMNTIL